MQCDAMRSNVMQCNVIQGDSMWCNAMQCNAMWCGPLEVIFQHIASMVGDLFHCPGLFTRECLLREQDCVSHQIFCSRMVRGADKRCRTVRTKVRVRSGGSARHSGSQWRWTGVRLATILGHWSRTLRSDNGVQRVTLRFNSSQAETHLSFHFQDFRLISCFAGKLLSHLFCPFKNERIEKDTFFGCRSVVIAMMTI